jgi:hypothetical protein
MVFYPYSNIGGALIYIFLKKCSPVNVTLRLEKWRGALRDLMMKKESKYKSRNLYSKKRVIPLKGPAMLNKDIITQSPLTEKRLVNTIWLKEGKAINPYQNPQGIVIPKDARLLGVNTLSLIRKESHD